jgi:class 3 adenylate cyclase
MTTAVLFFDLEDFTATTSSIPNEQTLNMLNIIIPTIMMLIRSYKGEVEKNTGDGVMAIFGSETRDNFEIARDAVEGAMTIRAAMLHHVQPLLERDLLPVMNFRIGIDMGEILVARIGNPTISFLTAVGSAANRAAKLQSLADTNGICIGENLYHHIYPELQYYCDERDDKEWDWFVTELNRRAYKFYDLTAQWVD